ncbi:MAG: DUF6036 family nucleotidyltransferase [Bacteroidota bacterium]
MDILDNEILKLWQSLAKHNVKYIMIGGFAANLHGFSRTTADIDLWIKDSLENRKKLKQVFNELELGSFENIETMNFLPGWSSINFSSGFELDVMTEIKGFGQKDFDECYAISPTAIIQDIPIKFLHINKLIEAKKAAARPKDLIDIIELEKLKNKNID